MKNKASRILKLVTWCLAAVVVAPIIAAATAVMATLLFAIAIGQECYERDMWFHQVMKDIWI